jgi:hypothetical protein
MSRSLLFLSIGLILAAPAAAQQVHLVSEVEHPSVEALRTILDGGHYQVIDRDTVIPVTAHLPGDLVVVGATLRLNGVVDGSVAVLNGTLFTRPGSRIGGNIVSVGGIILRSGTAAVGGSLAVPLEVEVMLTREGGDYTLALEPPPPAPRLKAAGLFGLAPPTYDRVNALTLRGGGAFRLGADSLAPTLRVNAALRTARWSPGGTAALVVPVGRSVLATLAGGRETRSSDRWQRDDLTNSAAAFFIRSDSRDYYDSDFATLTLAKRAALPLIPGETFLTPSLDLRVEKDRSLAARDVYTVLGNEPWRQNPAIGEGRIASIIPGAELGWRGTTAAAGVSAGVELGRFLNEGSWTQGSDFAQLVADGHWSMISLWQHTIALRAHYLQPLGSSNVPRQRWSAVGGAATLPTLEYDTRRGDHLLFIQSAYDIPVPRLTVPFLGVPSLGFRHAIGSAWQSEGASPRWAQNIGAGVEFSFLYLFVYLDPSEGHRTVLSYGVQLP